MNPYKILIKAYATQLFGLNKLRHTKSKLNKLKTIGMTIAMLYALITFVIMTTWYASMLADGLEAIGALNFLPLLAAILISLLLVIFSTYSIQGNLFTAKDYDLLLALPLKPQTILISKLFFTYIINCLLSACFFVPIIVIYYLKATCSPVIFAQIIVAILLLPLIPTLVATLLAYGMSLIASYSKKHGHIILTTLMLLLLIGTLLLQLQGNKLLPLLLTHHEVILNKIKLFYPPLYYLNVALTSQHLPSLLIFMISSILPTLLALYLLSSKLKRLVAKLSEQHQNGNFILGTLSTASPLKALYLKELKRYVSSPIYMINTCAGMILIVFAAIASFFIAPEQLEALLQLPNVQDYLPALLVVGLSGSAAITLTSAVSLSMEGKNLWIIQSLPITTSTLYRAKILVNLTISLPCTLLASILFTLSFKLQVGTLIYLLLIPSLYTLLAATSGLLINLYFPKFDWTSETEVVKQSASSLIAMLINMSFVALPIGIYILLKITQLHLFFVSVIIVLILLNIGCIYLLKTIGIQRFKQLH